MEIELKSKQFGMSMNTASLLTSSRKSLPDIHSAQSKRRNSEAVIRTETRPESKQGRKPRVALHGPGSLARHHLLEKHEPGEVLGRFPSVLPKSNSAKLGYYQWKKNHPWSYPKPKLIMKSIIHDKHSQLEEMRARAEYLETENKRLMQEIKDTDKKMDTDSRNLLEKHEQFMDKLARLKQGYESGVVVAMDLSEKKVQTLQRELNVLETKLEDEGEELKVKQDHLSSLVSYQQKEYPINAMAINELKGQEKKLEKFQKEEVEDLKKLVEDEMDRTRDKANKEKIQVFKKITDIAVKNTPDKVVALLQENKVLKKEILIQQKHIEGMTAEIESLTSNVSQVKKRIREREREKNEKIKPSNDADLEINGDLLDFPRQPVHVIL